jgi:hypothetical protein
MEDDFCSGCENLECCKQGYACEDYKYYLETGDIVIQSREPQKEIYLDIHPLEIFEELNEMCEM